MPNRRPYNYFVSARIAKSEIKNENIHFSLARIIGYNSFGSGGSGKHDRTHFNTIRISKFV